MQMSNLMSAKVTLLLKQLAELKVPSYGMEQQSYLIHAVINIESCVLLLPLLTFCVAGVENADVGIALDGQFPWSAW
jgi:hypothetical protein